MDATTLLRFAKIASSSAKTFEHIIHSMYFCVIVIHERIDDCEGVREALQIHMHQWLRDYYTVENVTPYHDLKNFYHKAALEVRDETERLLGVRKRD